MVDFVMSATYTVGILTVSDRAAQGIYPDRSGELLLLLVQQKFPNWQVTHRVIVPDEQGEIVACLQQWSAVGLHLILTSGGTGFAVRDVTPEATRLVLERETPGIAETLRAESLKITKHAMLSRGVAGIRGHTLIINLPGNPKAVKEGLDILAPVLPHALDLLNDNAGSDQSHRTV